MILTYTTRAIHVASHVASHVDSNNNPEVGLQNTGSVVITEACSLRVVLLNVQLLLWVQYHSIIYDV